MLTGVILAGGSSERGGAISALTEFDGVRLIERQVSYIICCTACCTKGVSRRDPAVEWRSEPPAAAA